MSHAAHRGGAAYQVATNAGSISGISDTPRQLQAPLSTSTAESAKVLQDM